MSSARIAICLIVAAVVGVWWLWVVTPTLRLPWPGDWTAFPVAVSVFVLAAVGLYKPEVQG